MHHVDRQSHLLQILIDQSFAVVQYFFHTSPSIFTNYFLHNLMEKESVEMRKLLEEEEASKLLFIQRVNRQLSMYLHMQCMLARHLAYEYLKQPYFTSSSFCREKIWSGAEAKAGIEKDEKRSCDALQIGVLADIILLLTDLTFSQIIAFIDHSSVCCHTQVWHTQAAQTDLYLESLLLV